MEVVFFNVTDNPKKIAKSLKDGTAVAVNYHIETNQYSPVIRVSYPDAQAFETNGFNYVKIAGTASATSEWEKRDKYFFITNAESIGKGLFNIHLKCDVLMTYKKEILNTQATVIRSSNNYNMYLNDGEYYKALPYPIMGCKEFPSGFGGYKILLSTFSKGVTQ